MTIQNGWLSNRTDLIANPHLIVSFFFRFPMSREKTWITWKCSWICWVPVRPTQTILRLSSKSTTRTACRASAPSFRVPIWEAQSESTTICSWVRIRWVISSPLLSNRSTASGCQSRRSNPDKRLPSLWRRSSGRKSGREWWWFLPNWTQRAAGNSRETLWSFITQPPSPPGTKPWSTAAQSARRPPSSGCRLTAWEQATRPGSSSSSSSIRSTCRRDRDWCFARAEPRLLAMSRLSFHTTRLARRTRAPAVLPWLGTKRPPKPHETSSETGVDLPRKQPRQLDWRK